MNHQVSTEIKHDDEIDLMELLHIVINEKKTIFITMLIVILLSLGGALYERNKAKKVSAIFSVSVGYKEENLLVANVLERVYRENNVRKANDISLDEFRSKFKVTGIIPKEIEDKREFLAKNAETLAYTPTSYRVDLRVGSIEESKHILEDYYVYLNEYYRALNESRYRFKQFDSNILADEKYSYEDYLRILDERKASLKELIAGREISRTDYVPYGFGYRRIQIALQNLENIRIRDLRNYLLATNIVRNPDKFRSEYLNRKIVLENRIREKKEEAKNYKSLLEDYKFEDSNIVVPKGVKVLIGDNEKERYYIELMNSYLKVENELSNLQQQLDELVYISKNYKIGTEAERAYILESLKNIVKKYNNIVSEANILEAKENYINNGALIKLAAPIEIISNSKAKLIVSVGIVMGLFLGIMMAFIKNFYNSFKNFKKGVMVLALFSFVSISGYSKEEVTLQFTHKEMKSGVNPDKTPFNLEETLVKEFLVKRLKLSIEELKNVTITPIFPKRSLDNVEKRIKDGEADYLYLPTEYKVILNLKDSVEEKKIKENIINEFPLFYTNYFFQKISSEYDYLKDYSSYREILKAMDNLMNGLLAEVNFRRKNAETKEIFYEYNNLEVELNKIKNIGYRDILNYIKSNNIVSNIELEKTLLDGDNRYIVLELDSLKTQVKIYSSVLKKYEIGDKKASVLENGDISMSSETGLREKQYIDISKTYLNNLNRENSLKIQLSENIRLMKEMKEPTKEQKYRISKELLDIQNNLNDIITRMTGIELRDYRREYIGSVRAF